MGGLAQSGEGLVGIAVEGVDELCVVRDVGVVGRCHTGWGRGVFAEDGEAFTRSGL